MDCPRCGLINPASAQRCDCGYDFKEGKVGRAYYAEEVPRELHQWAYWLLGTAPLGFYWSISKGKYWVALLEVGYAALVLFLFMQLLGRKNWARLALIVLTFPFGAYYGLTRQAKTYCLQQKSSNIQDGAGA